MITITRHRKLKTKSGTRSLTKTSENGSVIESLTNCIEKFKIKNKVDDKDELIYDDIEGDVWESVININNKKIKIKKTKCDLYSFGVLMEDKIYLSF